MITADTITDEQIRALDREARANGYDADHATASLCWVALYDLHTVEARESPKYKARARCAEILNERTRCDFRKAHDAATDQPAGPRCESSATHRIEWEDGRFSLACHEHLEIDDAASVKPTAVVPLDAKAVR